MIVITLIDIIMAVLIVGTILIAIILTIFDALRKGCEKVFERTVDKRKRSD